MKQKSNCSREFTRSVIIWCCSYGCSGGCGYSYGYDQISVICCWYDIIVGVVSMKCCYIVLDVIGFKFHYSCGCGYFVVICYWWDIIVDVGNMKCCDNYG